MNSGPVKDPHREHPIPASWRPTFHAIVDAFVEGDFQLTGGIPQVIPPSEETVEQIVESLADYGEVLCPLSEQTWDTSVAQWLESEWDVIVDLWTVGEGRSDLILQTRVSESEDGYSYEIRMVYVP